MVTMLSAGTPMAMAQSTLGFGLFSLAFDYMGARKAAVPPAEAAVLPSLSSSPCLVSAHTSRRPPQVNCIPFCLLLHDWLLDGQVLVVP